MPSSPYGSQRSCAPRVAARAVRMSRVAAALVLLSAVFPSFATAQNGPVTLRGVVRLATGEPLRGVSVAVAETGDNLFVGIVSTRKDGSFRASVPPGTYRLTAFPAASGAGATDLLVRTLYAVDVREDRAVEVVFERGTLVQTSIVSEAGSPLPGARVDVLNELFEVVTTTFADESGWVAFVSAAGQCALVSPPPGGGPHVARLVRFEELSLDASGIAEPIALDALAEPREVAPGLFELHRGRDPGPRVKIAVLSEGFTAGDESFEDLDGNGVCDDEPFLDANGNGSFDPAERFVDANRNGRRDAEPFADANGDGVCNRGERELFLAAARDQFRVMLGQPVFRELRERFDVYAIFVPSSQAGSSFPTLPVPELRETLLASEFRSTSMIFRLDHARAHATARAVLADYHLLAVVTYDLYGVGRESAGSTVNLFGTRRLSVSTASAHEFGHALGGLADEYFAYDGAPPYTRDEPDFPNVTRMSAVSDLKWARFTRAGTELPTPDGTPGVGAFEGGYYRRYGIARPTYNCLMRSVGIFCPVCADALLSRFRAITGNPTPAAPAIAVPRDGQTVSGTATVGLALPDLAAVDRAQLLVDGAPAGAPTAVAPFGIQVVAGALAPGTRTLAVELTLVDGSRVRTPGVRVTVAPRERSAPSASSAAIRGGGVLLEGAEGLVLPGASLLVGADRYALVAAGDGSARVPKEARGTVTGRKVAKAVRRAGGAALLLNPDGGRAELHVAR